MNLFWEVSFLVVFVVWNGLLTFYIFRMVRHYNRLTGETTEKGLKEILEALLTQKDKLGKNYKLLEEEITDVRKTGNEHLQRVGIVRFNPFADTGGNQSFSLAIIDTENNGMVMTSLYGRNGNRWYVKRVVGGKGESELSKEERAAIMEATPLSELSNTLKI